MVIKADSYLKRNLEIIDYADLESSEGAVITIDAPLVVPNTTGSRPAEQQLTQMFWAYDAAPFPSNLSNPAFQERGRIRQLVAYLEAQGFTNRPAVPKQQEQRSFLEVFPAPALVVLFPALNRNGHFHGQGLRYKHRAERAWAEIHSEWEIYRARLRSLENGAPAMTFSPSIMEHIGIDITAYKSATSYKQWDDVLDAIFCAYLAFYFWSWGEERCRIIGDTETGCVTLPKCKFADCQQIQHLRGCDP